jgi:hypothetical protein
VRFWLLFQVAVLGCALTPELRADPQVVVGGTRVLLGDLVAGLPSEVAILDFAPAPPAGSSRLVAGTEIRQQLTSNGVHVERLRIPASIRVVSAARRFSPTELVSLLTPAVTKNLRRGVKLVKILVRDTLQLPPDVRVGRVEVPKPPRRVGQCKSTALVELMHDDVLVQRLAVPVELDVSEAAVAADLPRGSRVSLVIQRRNCVVTAEAMAVVDADLGEVAPFRVLRTQRILQGRVVSASSAQVVEQ